MVWLCVWIVCVCSKPDSVFCVCKKAQLWMCTWFGGHTELYVCLWGVYSVSGWPADEDRKPGAVRGQLKAYRGFSQLFSAALNKLSPQGQPAWGGVCLLLCMNTQVWSQTQMPATDFRSLEANMVKLPVAWEWWAIVCRPLIAFITTPHPNHALPRDRSGTRVDLLSTCI